MTETAATLEQKPAADSNAVYKPAADGERLLPNGKPVPVVPAMVLDFLEIMEKATGEQIRRFFGFTEDELFIVMRWLRANGLAERTDKK